MQELRAGDCAVTPQTGPELYRTKKGIEYQVFRRERKTTKPLPGGFYKVLRFFR